MEEWFSWGRFLHLLAAIDWLAVANWPALGWERRPISSGGQRFVLQRCDALELQRLKREAMILAQLRFFFLLRFFRFPETLDGSLTDVPCVRLYTIPISVQPSVSAAFQRVHANARLCCWNHLLKAQPSNLSTEDTFVATGVGGLDHIC